MKAQNLVLMILLVAVTLVVGVYILQTLSSTFTTYPAVAVNNETLSNFTVAGVAVAGATANQFANPVVILVTNFTGGNTVIPANNYTITSAGLFKATAGSPFLNQKVNVSYTYTYTLPTAQGNASDTAASALNTGTSWVSIWVVVGFAVIVLILLNKGLGGSASGATGEQNGPLY